MFNAPPLPRLLALPPDARALLAGVEGPGWYVWESGRAPTLLECRLDAQMAAVWWPANPAAAVAAVLYPPGHPLHDRGLYHAHELLRVRLVDGGDDHEAALSIIEAAVAARSPA